MDQKFVPVITLVLYFGTEHKWRKPQCLKDVIKVPEGLDHYVNDYAIHVVHVDEILKLLSVMTGDKNYEKIIEDENVKEVQTMCEVLEYYTNKGIEQGGAQGIEKEQF